MLVNRRAKLVSLYKHGLPSIAIGFANASALDISNRYDHGRARQTGSARTIRTGRAGPHPRERSASRIRHGGAVPWLYRRGPRSEPDPGCGVDADQAPGGGRSDPVARTFESGSRAHREGRDIIRIRPEDSCAERGGDAAAAAAERCRPGAAVLRRHRRASSPFRWRRSDPRARRSAARCRQ